MSARTCPPRYVAEHTTLAYAVTAYGSQGLDVDSSHSLVDRGTDRAGVYVPGTRGRDANTFYVICQHQPDHHDPERIDRTPVAVLTDILTRPDDGTTAAELARRAGAEETRSLAWVGTQWALLTAEHIRHRATDTLAGLVAPDVLRRASRRARLRPAHGRDAGDGAGRARPARGAHRGRRPRQPARPRTPSPTCCATASGCSSNGGRTPERAVRDGDWTTYTARWAGPVGDYVQVLAAAATARQTELGARAAADPPAWAVAAPGLGVPPVDPAQRAEWVRRAGIVAAYRDLHGVPDGQLSIGEAPSPQRAFHHALWRQALTALGHPSDALDYATATDAELREMRDAWRRAQTWAPPYVADTLHDAREVAEEYRRDAVIWRAGLDRHPSGSAERALAERDLAAAEHLAAVSAARVAALERVQAVRTDWAQRTRTVEERARFARDELERRGLDRDTAAPAGEQQELFTVSAAEAGALTPTDTAAMADTAAAHTAAETAVTQRDVHGAECRTTATRPPRRARRCLGTGPGRRHRVTGRPPGGGELRQRFTRPRPVRPTCVPRSLPSRRRRCRTGMPRRSPTRPARPTVTVTSRRCSTCTPAPLTSPPRSRLIPTTPPAVGLPPAAGRTRASRPASRPRSLSRTPPARPTSSPRCAPKSTPAAGRARRAAPAAPSPPTSTPPTTSTKPAARTSATPSTLGRARSVHVTASGKLGPSTAAARYLSGGDSSITDVRHGAPEASTVGALAERRWSRCCRQPRSRARPMRSGPRSRARPRPAGRRSRTPRTTGLVATLPGLTGTTMQAARIEAHLAAYAWLLGDVDVAPVTRRRVPPVTARDLFLEEAPGRDHAERNTHRYDDPERLFPEAVFDAIAWARGDFDDPPSGS